MRLDTPVGARRSCMPVVHHQIVRLTIVLVLAGLVYLVAAAVILWRAPQLDHLFRPSRTLEFSSAGWLASDPESGNATRYAMSNDLIGRRMLITKSKREVIALLGEPTYTNSGGEGSRDEILYYDIGGRRQLPASSKLLPFIQFWNIESWVLRINLKQGRVTAVTVGST